MKKVADILKNEKVMKICRRTLLIATMVLAILCLLLLFIDGVVHNYTTHMLLSAFLTLLAMIAFGYAYILFINEIQGDN